MKIMSKEVIALMPMKGHSERVPNKNVRDFNGKPLLYWVLNELNKSNYISKIVVNTDDKKIKEIIKEYFGKEIIVIDRPESLCGDFVSMNDIIKYDISQFKEDQFFLQTHCTNPLLKTETINNAIETFFDNRREYDSLLTVNRIQCRCYDHNGQPINHTLGELKRTQDLNPVYEENSNMFIFSASDFKKNGDSRVGINPFLFEMDKVESIDIDEKEDFVLAEKLHKEFR